MNRTKTAFLLGVAVALFLGDGRRSQAQQHRATHLGNPATRFAPPLRTPEDLRARFRDPRLQPDFAEVLRQWGWKGNLKDLFHAAATAPITEVRLPKGTRLPFMSSREKGRPIALRDVLWAGKEPIPAYTFNFTSNGRRYRCVTPKPCSNFLVIDLGPDAPKLEMEVTTPDEIGLCDPAELRVLVRNAGYSPLTEVRIVDDLPPCLTTPDGRASVDLPVGLLRPGEVRIVRFPVKPTRGGDCPNTVRVTSREGAKAEAKARIRVRAPVLELACDVPAESVIGRPTRVCTKVRNTGDAPESHVTVTLSIPPGATVTAVTIGGLPAADRVTWELPTLGPGEERELCAAITSPSPTALSFTTTASGDCAPPVENACALRIAGVPGILLEVVDVADPVEVGGEVTYDIRITNQGSIALTNIRPEFLMPDLQEFVSAQGTTAVQSEAGVLSVTPVALLEPKATASWRLTNRARAAGNARFEVRLTVDQLPRGFGENETTNQY